MIMSLFFAFRTTSLSAFEPRFSPKLQLIISTPSEMCHSIACKGLASDGMFDWCLSPSLKYLNYCFFAEVPNIICHLRNIENAARIELRDDAIPTHDSKLRGRGLQHEMADSERKWPKVKQITSYYSTKEVEEALDLVCPYLSDLVHGNQVKTRVKDTGTWLFTLPAFENWRKTSVRRDPYDDAMGRTRNSYIWLRGDLGSGKTMLMSAGIDHLTMNERNKTAVLHFYFTRSVSSSPSDAMASLLRQLYSQAGVIPLPQFLNNYLKLFDSPSTNGNQEEPNSIPLGDMISDFFSLQSHFDRIYICLDGLEERDDITALFKLLARLTHSSPSLVAISARPQIVQRGIEAKIGSPDMVVIIEQHNTSDIRRYLEECINKNNCVRDIIGEETIPSYVEKLAERSDGKSDVTRHVDKPIANFEVLFNRIICCLNDQPRIYAALAKRIFYWLSISRRGLTFRELQQAIAIDPKEYQVIDQAERLSPHSLIERVCIGFIQVDMKNDYVFFNASFAAEAKEHAARCCIRLLDSKVFSSSMFKSQEDYDQMDRKLPFSRYVSQHWGTHLNDLGEDGMGKRVEKILEDEQLMHAMSQLLHINRLGTRKQYRYDAYPSGFGRRHFEAYFDLRASFRKRTRPQDWEGPKDGWGRKPLDVASISPSLRYTHTFLPDLEAKAYTSNGDCAPRTIEEDNDSTEDKIRFRHEPVSTMPWTWDSISDAKERLRVLLSCTRKNMSVIDNKKVSPLHHWISEWSEDQFEYILGALLNQMSPTSNGNDTGPYGSINKIDLLPTHADGRGRTILDYACQRNMDLVDVVLNTASITATSGHLWAVYCLFEEAGKLCKAKTLSVVLQDALIKASKRGFTDIVHDPGATALHYAAYGNHLRTVRYLLLEGVDSTSLDGHGRTPLYYAYENGNKDIVYFL
ncbi:hypothetical protein F4774DRAFT_419891 [Daldinia eschscholtzii]|nr:hypothetical protein F4774DRAFT_419891 [Daldinia eschscholtzii]